MKKQLKLTLLIVALILVSGIAFHAYAGTKTSLPKATTASLIKRGDTQIANRINSLNTLSAKVKSMANVSDTAKASMQNNIQSQITALNALKKKIDSDTNINTLKTDVDSIAKSTQSYILVSQQESLAFAADRIMTDATQMEASAPTLQAKIADAKTAGKIASINDSELTDYNTKVSDAKTKAQASIIMISGLNPNSGNKTISSSNNATLKDARAKIMAAQKDLNAARQTASKIMVD